MSVPGAAAERVLNPLPCSSTAPGPQLQLFPGQEQPSWGTALQGHCCHHPGEVPQHAPLQAPGAARALCLAAGHMPTVLEHRPSPMQQHPGHRTLQIQHTPAKSSSSPLTTAIPSAMAPLGSGDEGSCFSPGLASGYVAAMGWDTFRSVWCPVPPALAAAPPAGGGCHLCWVAPGGSLSSWRRAGAARQPSTWLWRAR